MPSAIDGVLWLVAAAWAASGILLAISVRALPDLPAAPAGPVRRARVSVIVTARDEAARIRETLLGFAGQEAVDLQIIAVDDRSRDATGAIIAALAARDPRIEPLRIDTLPPEWLGKPHACWRGAARATGDWLLFTDGDAHPRPDVLARAVAAAERADADHVCLLPGEPDLTVPARAALLPFSVAGLAVAWRTNRDRFTGPIGVGAFNLVRARAYRAIGGHLPLRLEVVDDAKLGMLLLRAGGRTRVYLACEDYSVAWAGTLGGVFRALEKNLFAALEFSLPRVVVALSLGLGLWLGALSGPFAGRTAGLAAFGAFLANGLPAATMALRMRWGLAPALLAPFFFVVPALALGHSTWTTLRRGGVRWRDTFYPLDLLRRGVVRYR